MDLAHFGLDDMARCSMALRKLDAGAGSIEEIARRVVAYFRDNLVGDEGRRHVVLGRFYKTHALSGLGEDLVAFARRCHPDQQLDDAVKCLTLLATGGDDPAWNDRAASRGHRAIPLPSEDALARMPMIAQLIRQLGLATSHLLSPDPALLVDVERRTYNVFHVPRAEGSPYIPAQDFVRQHGVESVIGFGGVLPDGEMFAVILFTAVQVPAKTAELFRTLGLSVKCALLGVEPADVFEGDALAARPRTGSAQQRLESRLAALQELADVHEQTVVIQGGRLKGAMVELERARIEAEQASRAKSTFLATMSHELRTPMNAILGFTDLLHEDAVAVGNEPAAADLAKIRTAGRQLLDLINGLLDLSRIEAGRMDLFLEHLALGDVIREVLATGEPLVRHRGNRLVVEGVDAAGVVHLDRAKVRQVLLNLLSNACKFTERGTLTLRVDRSDPGRSGLVTLRLTDTGVGIPAEVCQRLFQPFVQADESTSRRYGGSGLGLAISQRFCALMGGDISVESAPGAGSTFTVRLPADARKELQPGFAPVSSPEDRPARPSGNVVLSVDDDPAILEMIQRALARRGFEVVTCTGGREAIELARVLRPIAITLDVLMPELDGWSDLSACHADPDLANIPVILLTVAGERHLAMALGALALLRKPIDFGALCALLERCSARPPSTALVVEDEPETREVIARHLTAAGWSVETAAEGAEGLEKLASIRPSVVLLDLGMPGMDGFEFLQRLAADADLRSTPVVVVTARDLGAAEWAELQARASRVVQKGPVTGPYPLDALCATVAALRDSPA